MSEIPPDRAKPDIYWDFGSICHFPDANGIGRELCHAVMLSFPDRLYWQSGTGDWESKDMECICTKQESVWDRYLGHCGYWWTGVRTISSGFRRLRAGHGRYGSSCGSVAFH